MAKPIVFDFLGNAKPLNKTLLGIEGGLAKLGKAGVLAGATLAAGVGAGLLKVGSDFNEASNTIRLGTGATGEALQALNADFKEVLKGVPASFGDASTAIADINTRLGLTGEPLQDLSSQFLELSRITGTDVAGNVDRITRVFGDWGTQVHEQQAAMDSLFRTSQATGIGIDELATSMVQFGAPLRNLGFGMTESQALLGLFNKTGVNTETVMAGLRAGIGKVAKAGESVPETFRRVVDEITAMGPGTESTALAIELFGQRSGPDLADAIAGGKFAVEDLMNAINTGEETIIGAGQDAQTLGTIWTKLKNNVFVAIEPVATRLFTALNDGMETVLAGARAMVAAYNGEGGGSEGFIGVMERLGAALSRIIPRVRNFVGNVRDLAEEVVPKIVKTVRNWIDTGKELIAFLKENDELVIGLGVAIAATVVPAFVAWGVSAAAAAVATAAAAAPAIALGVVIAGLTALVVKAYREHEGFRNIVQSVGRAVRDQILPQLRRFGKWIIDVGVPAVREIGRVVGNTLIKVGTSVTEAWGDFKRGLGRIKDAITGFPNTARAALNKVKDAIIEPFRKAFEWVETQWKKLQNLLGANFGGTRQLNTDMFSKGNSNPNAGTFARQMGGPVSRSEVFTVGERGPEDIFLPKGSEVRPAHASSSRGNVTVNVASNADPFEIAGQVGWALAVGG